MFNQIYSSDFKNQAEIDKLFGFFGLPKQKLFFDAIFVLKSESGEIYRRAIEQQHSKDNSINLDGLDYHQGQLEYLYKKVVDQTKENKKIVKFYQKYLNTCSTSNVIEINCKENLYFPIDRMKLKTEKILNCKKKSYQKINQKIQSKKNKIEKEKSKLKKFYEQNETKKEISEELIASDFKLEIDNYEQSFDHSQFYANLIKFS